MSFNAIKYYVFYKSLTDCGALESRDRFTLAIKICLKTCLSRVNLRQITLLLERLYTS